MNGMIFSPIDKRQLILEIAEEVTARILPELQPPVQEDELIQIREAMKLLVRSRTTSNNWRCPFHFPTCTTVLQWVGKGKSLQLGFLKHQLLKKETQNDREKVGFTLLEGLFYFRCRMF